MAQDRPLTGIKVIDYSHFLAGPFMSRALAALGADVIKVERPKEGDAGRAHAMIKDGQSTYFLQQNMGKQGLCVNVKDPRGIELLHKLIAEADVFVENYRPGALDKLGLGYAQLSKLNPRLIYCSVSAYGHTGPDSKRPGFGLIAEARSGVVAQIGRPGETPPLPRIPVADMYTGAHGIAAICAALFGRERSGKGQHIDLALYDCMISIHDYAVQQYANGGPLPVQTGSDQPESTVYGVFPARDGYLVIPRLIEGEQLAELRRSRAGGRCAVSWPDQPQCQPAGRAGLRDQVDARAALPGGVHGSARRGRRALRARQHDRRGDRRSADQGEGYDRRAGSSGARPCPPAEPAVSLLRLRYEPARAGTAARSA